MRRSLQRVPLLIVAGVLALGAASPAMAQQASGWVTVDYGQLVDRRELSHSGQPVGALLDELDGHTLPPPGERPGDLQRHRLLDPLLEPYARVLPDAVDALTPAEGGPWIEVGLLWDEGAAQPAWAELLRARRYLVESDGHGRLRIFLPLQGDPWREEVPPLPSARAAETALAQAWPVVRLVLDAERRRLAGDGDAPTLELTVRAYRHLPASSRFHLGIDAMRVRIDDPRADGLRPPLDLAGWRGFLDSGLRLEGGRLEPDGRLRLLGSRGSSPTILGHPLSLADVAVAYRAVLHGGLAEPYMSLDRGYSPQTAIVNYGGRLRDTDLGTVSLLCDVRFKTFSIGLDIASGRDRREEIRGVVPGFRTHLERFAADPASEGITGQQTRLWFYPDDVDLTLSPESDLMAVRRARMSAASERVETTSMTTTRGDDPPWTRATVAAIDADYDHFATLFPELADLDEVVRLLAFFTWLRDAGQAGVPVPELDALLAIELPARSTPRTYPQLLAYNALPPAGSRAAVDVFDRVAVGDALERLDPASGVPLPARRRFARALAFLDPANSQLAAVLDEMRRIDPSTADPGLLDLLTFRAERVRMHQTVLATLDPADREALEARQEAGTPLRRFSLAIGGLDLGMGPVLERARRRAVAGEDAGARAATARRAPAAPVEAWRTDPAGLPHIALPPHGLAPGSARSVVGDRIVEVVRGDDGSATVRVVYADAGPGVRSRTLDRGPDGRVRTVERVERGRLQRYRFETSGAAVRAVLEPADPAPASPAIDPTLLPAGLASLEVVAPEDPAATSTGELPTLGLRLAARVDGEPVRLEAEVPRPVIQRLVLGHAADLAPGQSLAGLAPLPPSLGGPSAVMVASRAIQRTAPWEAALAPTPGEEDPATLAGALNAWWRGEAGSDGPRQSAFVGLDLVASPARWAAASGVASAVLLLPGDGFVGPAAGWRERLASVWPGRTVDAAEALAGDAAADLVVVVSAEAPDLFAARMERLAASPALKGRALAGWCLTGPVREDLAWRLMDGGGPTAVGLAGRSVTGQREAGEAVAALGRALGGAGTRRRVETLPGPFVWYY